MAALAGSSDSLAAAGPAETLRPALAMNAYGSTALSSETLKARISESDA
jgi:hypothetical protein